MRNAALSLSRATAITVSAAAAAGSSTRCAVAWMVNEAACMCTGSLATGSAHKVLLPAHHLWAPGRLLWRQRPGGKQQGYGQTVPWLERQYVAAGIRSRHRIQALHACPYTQDLDVLLGSLSACWHSQSRMLLQIWCGDEDAHVGAVSRWHHPPRTMPSSRRTSS